MRTLRSIMLGALLLAGGLALGQSPALVAGEYFLNADPGAGNATAFNVTPGATTQAVFFGDASALLPGLHSLNIRFKDADGQWGIAKGHHFLVVDPSGSETFTPAPDIVAGEYFLNADPGAGNATAFNVTPGATTQAVFLGDASALLPGLHSLNIRFKDADGQWGIAKGHHFLVVDPSGSETFTPAPDIVAGEYFLNADPGAGNATAFNVTPGATTHAIFLGDASALLPGLHSLNIRFKNADGQWGIAKGHHFLVVDPSGGETFTPAPDIVAGEYFLNADPGAGNATAFNVTPGATTQAIFLGDASALLPGLHSLNIRFKDADGQWGIAKGRHFLVVDPSGGETFTPAPDIVAGEYFLNADPGAGNATAFNVTPGATTQAVFLGDASTLLPGLHSLNIRFKDADGQWGIAKGHHFLVVDPSGSETFTPAPDIVAGEYFLNSDPGAGNATAFNVTPGATTQAIFLGDASALPVGTHRLMVRFKDASGQWGIARAHTFDVEESTAEYDLRLQAMDLPSSVCLPTAPLPVTVTVRNNGVLSVDTFMVHMEVDGIVHTEQWDTTLAPGATADLTLAHNITLNAPGGKQVMCWVELAGDEDQANDTLTTLVAVHPPVLVTLEDDLAICAGDTVTLHAAGGSAYAWNTSATTPNIRVSPAATTTYTVTVTGIGGCSALDSVTVTVIPVPPAPIVSPGTAAICPGGSVTLASNLSGVVWSHGATGPEVSITQPGSYFATNTDAGTGCSASSNVVVVGAAASLSILPLGPLVLCQGDVLDLVAQPVGSSISWSGGSTADTLHYQGLTLGMDTIVLSGQTAAGCDRPDSVFVSVIPSAPPDPVVEMLPLDGLLFIPTPVTLSYQPVPTAGWYDIHLWPEGAPEPTVPFVNNTTNTNIQVSGLLPGTTYHWFVRAFNSCDSSQSTTRSFSTAGTIDLTIDTLIIPSSIVAGTDVQVSFVCRNLGSGSTGTTTWNVRFWLSTDNDLRIGDDHLLKIIPNLTWLGPGQSYAQTVTVHIPQEFSGTYFFYVIADNDDAACWSVETCLNGPYGHHNSWVMESDENNNFSRGVVQIAIPPAPDLIPYLVGSASGPFNSNAVLPVAFGFRNIGELILHDQHVTGIVHVTEAEQYDDPSWALPASLGSSGNLGYPDGAARYFRIHLDALEPGQDTIVQVPVQLQPYMNGTYHVFATIDAGNAVFEADGEQNNWLEREGTIECVTAAADLVPLALSLPATKASGTTLTIPYQWKNLLPITPVVSNYVNKAYLSTSPVLDPANARLLGTRFRNDGLSLTQDLVKSDQFSSLIPIDTLGAYYVHVWIDASDDIYESDAGMHANVVSQAITFFLADTIDLVVSSVNAPATALSGQTVDVTVGYGNIGPDALNQTASLGLYRSTYAQYHPDSAVLVGAVPMQPANLGAGASLNATFSVAIPNGYQGPMYFHAFADRGNVVFELNESNIATAVTAVSLAAYPDISATFVNAPALVTPRTDLAVSYTVTNTGDAPVSAFDRTDRYILSADTILGNSNDIDLGTRTFTNTSIGVGGNIPASATLDLVYNFPYGPRYLFILVDANNTLFEFNDGAPAEGNNVSASVLVTVAPAYTDVAVENLLPGSANVFSGQTTSAQFQVRNLGPNTADRNIRVDRLYLSADAVVGGDYMFNTTIVPNVLDSGETAQRSFSYQIPYGISGDWYLIAVTDATNQCMNDSVPGNNLATAPIHIQLSDPVDLRIASTDPLPGTIYAGQCLALGYSVVNDSVGSHVGTWHDRVLINSAPSTIGASPLASVPHTGIAGTSGYSATISFCLPGYMTGSRYLILRTDAYNNVYEHQAEANNDVIIPIFLQVPTPTDLEVTMVEGPATWYLGFEDEVVLNVRNNGPGVAVGMLGNNVHFSVNQLLEPLIDPLLGNKSLGILLDPGEDIDITLDHLLAGIDIGSYYLTAATNTQVSISETNLANNTASSASPTQVDAIEFLLNDTTWAALNTGNLRYYKVEVTEPGLDVLVSLLTDQPFNDNRLYVSLDHVPTQVNHDFGQITGPNGTRQVLIPSAALGTYFILATTQVQTPNDQNIGVTAVGLPFSIVAVNPGTVGQGPVTTTIIGAGFTPDMVFALTDGGNTVAIGSVTGFVNSMLVKVGWDMTVVDTGLYVVEAVNDALEFATYAPFRVAEGDDYVLLVSDESAEVLKSAGMAYLTYKVTNDGIVDIPIITLELVLDSGIVVHEVVTSPNIIRADEIADLDVDTINYSVITNNGYTTITMLASGVPPQEELMVSVAISGQRSPSISPVLSALPSSYEGFIMQGLYQLSSTRNILLSGVAEGYSFPESLLAQLDDVDALVNGSIQFLVTNGIVDPVWYAGYIAECPDCLALPIDPGLPIGVEHFDELTLGPARAYIWQIDDLNGGAGVDPGWDLIEVDGTLAITADTIHPVVLNITPISENGMPWYLADFHPCQPYTWPIIEAGVILGFDTSKFFIDDDYFRILHNTPAGAFQLVLQDSTTIVLQYVPACVPCDTADDADSDGMLDCQDLCPLDPFKVGPGSCGCGIVDIDTDSDGFKDCQEACDLDPNKQFPGFCGCGIPDIDSDGDGWLNCFDLCPYDANKRFPGTCGCGTPDLDADGNSIPDCIEPCAVLPDFDGDGCAGCFDHCPNDANKCVPGTCGCNVPDTDSDDDGTPDCIDLCPWDPNKIEPGWCDCGNPDIDEDEDGFPSCVEECDNDPQKLLEGACGCGNPETDWDGDWVPDCIDRCLYNPYMVEEGPCGCELAWDSDGDGCPDCMDACPLNPTKCADEGDCGCGQIDGNVDGDECADCDDLCPNDPSKCEPGSCGCGFEERSPCVECKTLESNTCSMLFNAGNCAVQGWTCGASVSAFLGFAAATPASGGVALLGVTYFGATAITTCHSASKACVEGLSCNQISASLEGLKESAQELGGAVRDGNIEDYFDLAQTDVAGARKLKFTIKGRIFSSIKSMGISAFIQYALCEAKSALCKRVASPCDPNEMIGPTGVGDRAWIAENMNGSYTVNFENDSLLASSNAQVVRVTVPLDDEMNAYAFRVGNVTVGDTTIQVPQGLMYHSIQFLHNGVLVQLNAGVDIPNREAYWVFESLDPLTLLPPYSPLVGFLPVNDSLGSGTGSVSFSIRPNATAETRDTLSAQAEIVFDINEPILTNTWTNLLDAEGPHSQVDSLVSVNDSTVVVHYTAIDPNQGSGVERVDLYASQGGGAMQLVVANLHPNSEYLFKGNLGLAYCFATVAHDSVYHTEALPVVPDQCIMFTAGNTVRLAAKVFLGGPYDAAAELMHDSLRVHGLIPLAEPYTGLGYTHVGGGGGETITPAVLTISGSNAIVDWVVIELRDKLTPASVLASRSALVQRDGDVVDLDGISPVLLQHVPDNYYVAIRHRNHLGAMSAAPVALSSATAAIDLTDPAFATYGTEARRAIAGQAVLWSGDVLLDGVLRYTGSNNDRDPILVSIGGTIPTNIASGYHPEDVNMDGLVKYAGTNNDRDPILVNVGGLVPTNTRLGQFP